MLSNCRLRLIQSSTARLPGDDETNEKGFIIQLTEDTLLKYTILGDNLTPEQIINWTSQGYSTWGKYSIKGDHKGNLIASNSYIGEGEPKNTLKIWRYNPAETSLYFATIKTGMVGGGLEYGEHAIEVRKDLVLHNAIYSGSKIKIRGERQYSNGSVDNGNQKPFRTGTLYWMQSDN